MKPIAAFVAAIALLISGAASGQSMEGRYDVTGTNFDGTVYVGTAEIQPTSETTCTIEWKTAGDVSRGICMRNGDAFVAGYSIGDRIGLVSYKIMPDRSLTGVWTIAGQNGSGTETLTPR